MALQRFAVLLAWDNDSQVWVTYVPALGHLSTFGTTKEEALANTEEAILGYLEAAAKEGIALAVDGPEPEIIDLQVTSA